MAIRCDNGSEITSPTGLRIRTWLWRSRIDGSEDCSWVFSLATLNALEEPKSKGLTPPCSQPFLPTHSVW